MNQPMELSNLKLDFGANDQGFTLLELLMATLVTTMVLITITPPLFLAVATRVQAQRMEQAVQFAQQNLELVRWVMNQNPSADQLPATVMEDVRQGLPPTSFVPRCGGSGWFPCSPSEAVITPDGQFAVQVFRNPGFSSSNGTIGGFRAGIRIYSIESQAFLGSLERQTTPLKLTSAHGSRFRNPLVAIYPEVLAGDRPGSLDAYSRYLNRP